MSTQWHYGKSLDGSKLQIHNTSNEVSFKCNQVKWRVIVSVTMYLKFRALEIIFVKAEYVFLKYLYQDIEKVKFED